MATSQNGWPVQPTPNSTWALAAISGRVLAGPVWVVMAWLARQYAARVEPITRTSSWGWTYRRIAGSTKWSNHASATAVDFNAPAHPAGRTGTFTTGQAAAIRAIISEAGGVLRWGDTFRDEMHFEIAPGTTRAAVDRFATQLLQDALNTHGAHLVVDGVRGPKTRDALAAHQAAHKLTVDGIDGPATWATLS